MLPNGENLAETDINPPESAEGTGRKGGMEKEMEGDIEKR